MKVAIVLLTLLIGVLLLNSCKKDDLQPTVQLLQNGDMEQNPTQNWLFDYYYSLKNNPNHYQPSYTTEAAASGTHSLKITCDTIRNDTTFCYFSQVVTPGSIPIGAKLTLKAKVKTRNLQGEGISISMFGYKTNSLQNTVVFSPSTNIPASGNTDFTEYAVTLGSYPGNVDAITVYLFYQAKTIGTVYFDDVSLNVN